MNDALENIGKRLYTSWYATPQKHVDLCDLNFVKKSQIDTLKNPIKSMSTNTERWQSG